MSLAQDKMTKVEREIADSINELGMESRAVCLTVLDRLTRRLTPREIDERLRKTGLSRVDRRRLTLALKHQDVIIIT